MANPKRTGSTMLNPASRGAYVFRNQEVMNLADTDNNGLLRKTLTNACLLMRDVPEMAGRIAFNEFSRERMVISELPWSSDVNRQWTDDDTRNLKIWLDQAGLTLSTEITFEAAAWASNENKFHPVRDHLNGLKWDGTPRVDTWLTYYLGAADSEFNRLAGRMFLIAMVARIFKPGCKVDHMLVLEGAQGLGKSTVCKILAGQDEYFTDAISKMDGKDASQAMRGRWIVEIAELAAFRKSEVEQLKSFLTRREEKYRPPYGKHEVTEPRQCVFVGTTNESHYLKDPTGSRRFWPVKCESIDINALAHDRDQLIAEAVAAYRAGECWWPDSETERRLFAPEQDARHDEDEWQGAIAEWLNRPKVGNPTTQEIADGALGLQIKELRGVEGKRISGCMTRLGWEQTRLWVNGSRPRVWVRQEDAKPYLTVVK